ncbi:hypothetical protein E2986_00954 [Frieseomelitta varia]|uniref:Uncharacterized protein n=1 Tax=Frieseomelitta varia TaxID=561572 RepID=A0A833VQS7_9HYME|nr:hypothetical protein E2986_00954 [Frieseomelitta varia]
MTDAGGRRSAPATALCISHDYKNLNSVEPRPKTERHSNVRNNLNSANTFSLITPQSEQFLAIFRNGLWFQPMEKKAEKSGWENIGRKSHFQSLSNDFIVSECSIDWFAGEVSGENVSASSGPRGGDRGEATDLGTHTENSDGATLAANTAVDARGGSPQGAHLSGAATPRPPRGRRRQNQNGLDTTQVKTERLTPDNNSTSSRSVTPSSSSHPGTPPNATPLGGPEGPPPPHHLKHMEQMMGRNYSDFMRSLAAKYNNANPNDYFSSPRNGYPPGLDPRFPGFKAGATPFVGLMAPLGAPQPSTVSTTSPLSNKDPKEQKQDTLFGNPVFPPMLDMSSTQALLHMVRTANAAQNAAELETYLKGANKRDAGVTSPLDLSSPGGFAPRKRQRAETRRSGSVSPKPKPTPRPTTPPPVRCPSLCGHMPCGDGQAVNRWTVEDVVNYVSSIDICAEYAQVSLL